LLGSVVSVIMKNSLSDENLVLFGWRIPFIISGVGVGAFFFIFRNKIEHDEPAAKDGENPIKVAIRDHWRKTLLVIFVTATWCSGFYLINVWINSFTTGIKIPVVPHGRVITMVCLFLHVLAFPVFGKLTDYVQKYARVMLVGAILLAVSAMPMFAILNIGGVDCDINDNKYVQNMTNQSQNEGTCVTIGGNFSHCPPSPVSETASIAATFGAQLYLTIVLAIYGSALPVWIVTSFPPEVRYTAVGLGYNLAQALLGGTAPLIATALIDVSHWNASPSIFLILTATLSAATLAYMEFGDYFFGKGGSDVQASYTATESTDDKTYGSETVEEEATL